MDACKLEVSYMFREHLQCRDRAWRRFTDLWHLTEHPVMDKVPTRRCPRASLITSFPTKYLCDTLATRKLHLPLRL